MASETRNNKRTTRQTTLNLTGKWKASLLFRDNRKYLAVSLKYKSSRKVETRLASIKKVVRGTLHLTTETELTPVHCFPGSATGRKEDLTDPSSG